MSEAKVGLLFFIGLGVALAFTLFVRDIGGGQGDYEVRFGRVQGLGTGDPVLFNGLRVGTVTDVRPELADGQPEVAVRFDVEERFRPNLVLNPQSLITVDKGMLGGAALVIETEGRGTAISQAGLAALRGNPPATISEVVTKVDDLVTENREDIREAISFLPEAVRRFSNMAEQVRGMIAENRANITHAITKLGDMGAAVEQLAVKSEAKILEAAGRMSTMSEEITLMVQENRPQVKAAVDQLPSAVGNIDAAADEIKRAVRDNRERIDTVMASLAEVGPKLASVGDDVKIISSQIASGKGTLGKLVFDEGLHDQAQAVLTSAEQRLEEVKPLTGGVSQLRFYIGLNSDYNTELEHSRTTVFLRIEPKPWKIYEGGFTWRTAPADRDTAKEDPDDLNIDLNFLIGWRFLPDEEEENYDLALRVGFFEGQIGGRATYTLMAHRLWADLALRGRHDEWEVDDRRFEDGEGAYGRFTLETRVWRRVFLRLGADDIFDDPSFFAGIRAELLDNDIRNVVAARSILP